LSSPLPRKARDLLLLLFLLLLPFRCRQGERLGQRSSLARTGWIGWPDTCEPWDSKRKTQWAPQLPLDSEKNRRKMKNTKKWRPSNNNKTTSAF
jgi:hypothetical protein